MAMDNPWRFSTKCQDEESGFYYYGHRYFDQGTGRWPNRDPLLDEASLRKYLSENRFSKPFELRSGPVVVPVPLFALNAQRLIGMSQATSRIMQWASRLMAIAQQALRQPSRLAV